MKKLCVALVILAGTFVTHAVAMAETLEISGGTAVKALMDPKLDAMKQATGVEIKFNAIGTGKGMVALMEGKVPAAAAGEGLDDAVDSARKIAKSGNLTLNVPANLVYHEIGKDELVVIVHKSNPVAALSKEQLSALFTGKSANWKEAGGPDLPVKVFTENVGGATRAVFQKQVMDGADYLAGATEVKILKEIITWVGRTPGGLGVAAKGHMAAGGGDAKTVSAPAVSRPLGLVTVGPATGPAQKVIDFLKK